MDTEGPNECLYSANHYAQDSDSPNKKTACKQGIVIPDGEKNWDDSEYFTSRERSSEWN